MNTSIRVGQRWKFKSTDVIHTIIEVRWDQLNSRGQPRVIVEKQGKLPKEQPYGASILERPELWERADVIPCPECGQGFFPDTDYLCSSCAILSGSN